MSHLTQKERMLLEDQVKHEEMCIKKYQQYAQRAQDPQLQQLFNSYMTKEQEHYDTLNQILRGQIPNTQQGQGQQGQQGQQGRGQQGQGGSSGSYNQNDADLCNDMLMTEKYVSGTYDTAIFEFTNPQIRQALNHIQKEEQQHGEGIFTYMQQQGMYKPS